MLITQTSEEMFTFAAVLDTLRWKSNADLVPYGMMASDKNLVGSLIKSYYAGSEELWPVTPLPIYIRVIFFFFYLFAINRFKTDYTTFYYSMEVTSFSTIL